MAENKMVPFCGLWESKTKSGDRMLSGKVSYSARMVILPNKFKTKDTHPDYQAYMAAADRDRQAQTKQDNDDDYPF